MFTALESHPWAYPVLEIFHIFGIALLVGNLVLLERRVFGRGAALPVMPLARLSLGLAFAGFTLVAASGLLMFATRPGELLANGAFILKMLLLLAAGLNATLFHVRKSLVRLDSTARVQMVFSTVIWVAVITCGRWIAYL